MPKIIRDWLFIVFIILFFIITFFVTLYAAGYTINRQWPLNYNNLFQKTGMLIVDSSPTGANVFLNGERQNKSLIINWGNKDIKTPAKIKNLPPGKYNLHLEKEGYWSLDKKIEIKPGQTSFEEDFIIFKKSLPLNITNCQTQKIHLSANRKSLVLEDDSLIIDLKTGNSSNYNNKQINPLNFPLEPGAYNLYWDKNRDKLYYQLENQIKSFSSTDSKSQIFLTSGKYLDYISHNNNIYTIETINEDNYLKIYNPTSALLESSIHLLAGKYHFDKYNKQLSLYNETNHTLYILNSNPKKPIVKKIDKVNGWQWINDDFIVWYNDSEIYSMNLNSKRPNLIVRISEQITSMAWNKSKSYLLYSSANNIWIVNLKLERIIPINILQANSISYLNLDEKNQIVYFYAQIRDQAGIYKLQLK